MTPTEMKAFFAEKLREVKGAYLDDLNAMSDDDLGTSPGGAARTGFDYTYETAYVNRRIAKRLRGEEPEPFPGDGWMKAPDEAKSKQAAIDSLTASMDEVIAAWDALPENDLGRVIPLAKGQTNPLDMAFLCVYHTGYHDAQLNFVQSLKGDTKMNWQHEG